MNREIKFRVRDGEKMLVPDILEFVQSQYEQRNIAYMLRGNPGNPEMVLKVT